MTYHRKVSYWKETDMIRVLKYIIIGCAVGKCVWQLVDRSTDWSY